MVDLESDKARLFFEWLRIDSYAIETVEVWLRDSYREDAAIRTVRYTREEIEFLLAHYRMTQS